MSQLPSRTLTVAIVGAMVLMLGLPANSQTASPRQPPTVDIAVTYAAAHTIHTSSNGFWLQGGAVELHAGFYRGLGAVASSSGLQIGSTNPQTAPLDLVTIVFGPRYTFSTRSKRLAAFGQVLAGEANGFNSNFATGSGPVNAVNGTTTSASSLAFQAGGGINLRLSRRFALRVIQADYLRTQLPNGTTNVQNNLRVAAGLVVVLGR